MEIAKWSPLQLDYFNKNGFTEYMGNLSVDWTVNYSVGTGGSGEYVFQNTWSKSKRLFVYYPEERVWVVGCFKGSSDELLDKAGDGGEEVYEGYREAVRFIEETEGRR